MTSNGTVDKYTVSFLLRVESHTTFCAFCGGSSLLIDIFYFSLILFTVGAQFVKQLTITLF